MQQIKLKDRWQFLTGRKSLYDLHPELRDRQPLARFYSDTQGNGGMGGNLENDIDYYKSNVWVRTAISRIADNIAPLKIDVTDREGTPIKRHPITELLEHVNDIESSGDLWRMWTINMLVDGESGLEIQPGYRGLYTRKSKHFNVRIPKGGRRYLLIKSYVIDDGNGPKYEIPPEYFIHFKFYDPEEPFRGISPMSAIRTGIQIDEYARAWSRMSFKNGQIPSMTIISPEGLTPTERREIQDDYMAQTQGLENAHKPVVMEAGVTDIKPNNYKPVDTAWLEQRQMSREEICSIYGVPAEVAGFGKATYENFENAMIMFWTITLLPLVHSRDQQLTEFFQRVKQITPDQKIVTDMSGVSELQENKTEQIDNAVKLINTGTPANNAFKLVGLDLEIPGGDVGYIQMSMIPMGSERPTQPAPVIPPEEPQEPEPQEPPKQYKKELRGPEFGSPLHIEQMQRKELRIQPFMAEMQRMLRREFQRQQNDVGRWLRGQRQLGKGAHAKLMVDEMFDLTGEQERFKITFMKLLRELFAEVGANELGFLDIEVAFDMNRPEVTEELDIILAWFAEKTNDTTYNNLVDLFTEAELRGDTIPQMMESLSAYWEGRKSEASTERIARTTMTAANNAGDESAWRQSGVVEGATWATAIDGRERDEHRFAHGQYRALGERFEVGGELLDYPGDPSGSPGNIINCRCNRLPVITRSEL